MVKFPKKFSERIQKNLKNYQGIVTYIKDKDASEADTVTVIKDILSDIFGFDKFKELTSEQQIKGTFCDLAIKIDGKVKFLAEVKSADVALTDAHLRQAINYGIHHNIEWVILTNSVNWRFFKIKFEQPIGYELVTQFDFLSLNARNDNDLGLLYLLAREGTVTNAIDEFHQKSLIVNKFMISEIIKSENIVNAIRKDFRKIFPDVKISNEDISEIIVNEIIRREILDGEKVKDAQSKIKRALNKMLKKGKNEKQEPTLAVSNDSTVIDIAS